MNYLEIKFNIQAFDLYKDVLIYELGEIGFESFTEENNQINAYINENDFDENQLKQIYLFDMDDVSIQYQITKIPQQNWNAEWEKNFPKVQVNAFCEIIAPFHQADSSIKHSIIIEPKMSFGTGHHDTTYMIISLMESLDFKDKSVLDMGCGTGVLAILAQKLHAKHIVAIDIDEWAFENTLENIDRNDAESIIVYQGGAEQIADQKFDFILANINRNILLNDMEVYEAALNNNGEILLSGFFVTDFEILNQKLESLNLKKINQIERNNWCALHYAKI